MIAFCQSVFIKDYDDDDDDELWVNCIKSTQFAPKFADLKSKNFHAPYPHPTPSMHLALQFSNSVFPELFF